MLCYYEIEIVSPDDQVIESFKVSTTTGSGTNVCECPSDIVVGVTFSRPCTETDNLYQCYVDLGEASPVVHNMSETPDDQLTYSAKIKKVPGCPTSLCVRCAGHQYAGVQATGLYHMMDAAAFANIASGFPDTPVYQIDTSPVNAFGAPGGGPYVSFSELPDNERWQIEHHPYTNEELGYENASVVIAQSGVGPEVACPDDADHFAYVPHNPEAHGGPWVHIEEAVSFSDESFRTSHDYFTIKDCCSDRHFVMHIDWSVLSDRSSAVFEDTYNLYKQMFVCDGKDVTHYANVGYRLCENHPSTNPPLRCFEIVGNSYDSHEANVRIVSGDYDGTGLVVIQATEICERRFGGCVVPMQGTDSTFGELCCGHQEIPDDPLPNWIPPFPPPNFTPPTPPPNFTPPSSPSFTPTRTPTPAN